ncbi:MAG: phosphatidylcholine synthase [Betaproteobacteria bacterium]|nr:phosphatidylcholine synthase [Betaproteobacteria bacterium]
MPSPCLTRARAYAVHLLTASGVVAAFLAVAELFEDVPDERVVFAWLVVAVVIDALDGPLARAWDVKRLAPDIHGRTIDDIVDYLTFTFVPLLLVWRMGWVPYAPGILGVAWIVPALLSSLLGFANVGAKDEAAGYFRGFPSYWNIAAFYLGLAFHGLGETGQWLNAVVLLALAALTVSPVRFLYPNLTPRPWKLPVMLGAAAWLAVLLGMLLVYRRVPGWVVGVSLIYPAFYATLSILLDRQRHGRACARSP